MIVKHNIPSLIINNRLNQNKKNADSVLEKLSSGYKLNRAGDDAAGLAISEKMRGQIRGLNMASKNIQDGISLLQTGEGAMNEIHSILQRLRELSVQSANDTYTNQDRELINLEASQLLNEIDSITLKTEFNTKKLLDGSITLTPGETTNTSSGIVLGNGTLHTANDGWHYFGKVGAKVKVNAGEVIENDFSKWLFTDLIIGVKVSDSAVEAMTIHDPNGYVISANKGIEIDIKGTSFSYNGVTIDVSEVTTRAASGHNGDSHVGNIRLRPGSNGKPSVDNRIVIQLGANTGQNIRFSVSNLDSSALGINNINLGDQQSASNAITLLDNSINIVSNERSKLGAIQNRLEAAFNTNTNTSENLQSAESRIRDTDMAKEMMTFTKNNILLQATQSMLAQSNKQPEGILQLLQ